VAVAFFGGPVMWKVAGATLTPGEQLQESSGQMIALTSGKFRGIALDPATSGQLFRMIIMTNVAPAS